MGKGRGKGKEGGKWKGRKKKGWEERVTGQRKGEGERRERKWRREGKNFVQL